MTGPSGETPATGRRGLLRVALTGGIATGKSHCLERFARLGVPVVDADRIARDVVAPGNPGFSAVVARFGRAVVDGSGALDRAALGRVVFSDEGARRDLEAIVHPLVYERLEQWLGQVEGPFAIADIPLLLETGREREFDRVIVAACPPSQQVERLIARTHLSREDAERRLAAQLPISEKQRRADYVIDTSGTTERTDRQVVEVWEALRNEAMGQ